MPPKDFSILADKPLAALSLALALGVASCTGATRRIYLDAPNLRLPRSERAAASALPPARLFPTDADSWKPYAIREASNPLAVATLEADERGKGRALGLRGDNGASGAYLAVDIDPRAEPFLEWEWSLKKRGAAERPLALMVGFQVDEAAAPAEARLWADAVEKAHGARPPLRSLAYVYGGSDDARIAESAFFAPRSVFFITLRANLDCDGEWRRELRDIARDYRAVFGAEAPAVTMLAFVGDARGDGNALEARLRGIAFRPEAARAALSSADGQSDPDPRFPALYWWLLGAAALVFVASGGWLARRLPKRSRKSRSRTVGSNRP